MIIFLFRFSSQIFCQRNFGAWILDNDATFITLKHNKSGFQGKNHSFIECSKLFVLMRFLNGRLEMVYQKKIICKHFAILKCFTVHILHTMLSKIKMIFWHFCSQPEWLAIVEASASFHR